VNDLDDNGFGDILAHARAIYFSLCSNAI